jgi:hypothetical protein
MMKFVRLAAMTGCSRKMGMEGSRVTEWASPWVRTVPTAVGLKTLHPLASNCPTEYVAGGTRYGGAPAGADAA